VPPDTNDNSFRNLAYPLDWEAIFNYVGWPAFFKPFAGGGWKNVYRLHNPEEFFRAYSETGQLVMMLQEEVKFDMYFRCYSIDQRNVRIMPYEPRHPYHLRYQTEWQAPKGDPAEGRAGVLTVESISRLRPEHGRVRHPRWRSRSRSIFAIPRRMPKRDSRWPGELSNGSSKPSPTWRFAKRASISPARQSELGQICSGRVTARFLRATKFHRPSSCRPRKIPIASGRQL
jgi:hypothetical protein